MLIFYVLFFTFFNYIKISFQ